MLVGYHWSTLMSLLSCILCLLLRSAWLHSFTGISRTASSSFISVISHDRVKQLLSRNHIVKIHRSYCSICHSVETGTDSGRISTPQYFKKVCERRKGGIWTQWTDTLRPYSLKPHMVLNKWSNDLFVWNLNVLIEQTFRNVNCILKHQSS